MQNNKRRTSDTLKPATYQIKLQGKLDESWSSWFDEMTVTAEIDADGRPITTLTGRVTDQPALHGLLSRIRDLGLLLLSVQRIN
ncbi:MAG: hypothetical protein EHM70_21310 [Chloroflexota bacterium]|nr:MAG: hypothetical protein EHM70_21310 [Chloroflexota bacterium]